MSLIHGHFTIYRSISIFMGVAALIIGVVGILGWLCRIPILTCLNSLWVTMKFNTALGFVLMGTNILILLAYEKFSPMSRNYAWLTRICTIALLFIGTITAIEYLFNVDLHIDELFVKQKPGVWDLSPPGRMSPFAAAMQINFGIALWLLDNINRKILPTIVAQCCAFLGGIIGILALAGYLLEARELYAAGHFTAIAANTAVGFIAVSLGILFLEPESGLMHTFTSQTKTGQILRRFVPLALVVPLVIGWIELKGQNAGHFGFESGLAFMVTFCIFSCEMGIFWITRKFQEVELALAQQQAQLQEQAELLNLTHDAIIVRDLDGKVLFWNRGAENLYEYSRSEAAGRVVHELLQTKFPIKLQDVELTLREKGRWEGELIHKTKSQSTVVTASRWSVKKDESGQPIAFLEINNDISAAKEAEKQMDEFYSSISHELRTPLTSMKGVFSLLGGGRVGDLSERAKHLVTTGLQETERLIRLISDMLDIKKMEAGKFEVRFENIEPKQLIEETVQIVREFAAQYKIGLIAEIGDNASIRGDKDRLMQVLTNLISNAVKFSDAETSVTIKTSRNNQAIRFSVTDTGPGIDPKNVSKLFRMFQQVDSANQPKGGTGLGLAICKSLIEQHDGTIGVDTELGKGTTFWFEIPCA